LEDGAKLRVNTTVVQTDIHHPTDNTLFRFAPTIRVLSDREHRSLGGLSSMQSARALANWIDPDNLSDR
jgi:hypothetical protein